MPLVMLDGEFIPEVVEVELLVPSPAANADADAKAMQHSAVASLVRSSLMVLLLCR